MATSNSTRILRAPATLIVDPTDLAAGPLYGGTEVGRARLVALTFGGAAKRVESELLGEATDVLEASPNQITFGCFLRGWNDAAVQKFLVGGYSLGAISGHAKWSAPGSKTPGESTISRAVKLLVLPDDPINVPALLIHRGIPDWSDSAELAYSRQEELGIPLGIDCLRGANGRILDVGRFADLSLS